MANPRRPILFVIVFLMIATLACSLGGKQSTKQETKQNTSQDSVQDTSQGLKQDTNKDSNKDTNKDSKKNPKLGETYKSEVGGFSLQKVTEYEFNEIFGMVIMKPSDGMEDLGPFIMAYGALDDDVLNAQSIWDEMEEDAGDLKYSKPKKTKIDGVEGLLIEFSGNEEGQDFQGKVFVAAPYPQQSFQITALAPKDRWKELSPIYDAVLKSVRFYEAEPSDFGFDSIIEDEDIDGEDWDWILNQDWDELWDEEGLNELFNEMDLEGLLDGLWKSGDDE
ncbi:MAG: hypothetical protein ACOX7C_09665 [Brevefilum sp.]|jgi:hypothetical protein